MPFLHLKDQTLGVAKTELVKGLRNKFCIHMKSNDPEEFLCISLYNLACMSDIYVENEPGFAQLMGYAKAVGDEPVATKRQSARNK